MSLWRQRSITGPPAQGLIPSRSGKGGAAITADTALRNSAVWACLRLRANLMSSFPLDVFRRVEGYQVEMAKPPVLVTPGGATMPMRRWLYSSQMDLDRVGNAIGLILEKDGAGLPARVELQTAGECSFKVKDGAIEKFRIRGTLYDPSEVWHEQQYTIGGLPFGLSPVAYAAWALGEYQSIQDFAREWFSNGAMPAATLKNNARTVNPTQAAEVKDLFRASVDNGDVFVHGSDWEFTLLNTEAAASKWVEAKQAGVVDIARYFDCPADLIDAAVSGQSITYANQAQRNLQFLVMNLGPAVGRREDALSMWLPRPRYVKFNTDALLRMDPTATALMLGQMVKDRLITPTEAREIANRPPYTDAQLAEFDRLFGRPQDKPSTTPSMSGGTP